MDGVQQVNYVDITLGKCSVTNDNSTAQPPPPDLEIIIFPGKHRPFSLHDELLPSKLFLRDLQRAVNSIAQKDTFRHTPAYQKVLSLRLIACIRKIRHTKSTMRDTVRRRCRTSCKTTFLTGLSSTTPSVLGNKLFNC